jgi:Methyltransferase domain
VVGLASARGGSAASAVGVGRTVPAIVDRLEETLVSDRERLISTLLDVVEAMAGTAPTLVDLACGPGSITSRLLDQLPRAHSIAVDVDPVLLTIASATFANDERARVVRADLRDALDPRLDRGFGSLQCRPWTHRSFRERWPRAGRWLSHAVCASMTRSCSTTRTGSRCAFGRLTCLLASRLAPVRTAPSSRSSSHVA